MPKEVNFWNYSIAVTMPDGQIFISGGIKHDLKTIQSEAYLLTPNENSMAAVKLPSMNTVRYTHTSVYLNNHVYCMGGRTYGEVYILSCRTLLAYTMTARDSIW